MTPYPESATASHLLQTKSNDYNPDLGILHVSAEHKIRFDATTKTVPIQPHYGRNASEIPCRGVLSIPMVVEGENDLHLTGVFDLVPASKEVVDRYGGAKRMEEVYSVVMTFGHGRLNMSAKGVNSRLIISTSNNGELTVYERYIASAVAVAPIESWEAIRKSGLVVIQDPVGYKGEPLIDLVALPNKWDGGALSKIETNKYVTEKMWERLGDPFVIHKLR